MSASLPLLAGTISTFVFVSSTLPMVIKAIRTRNMGSYSPGSLMLANGGNTLHSIYIFSLPPGPIWILHSFHVVVTLFMLSWYLRHEGTPGTLQSELFRLHIRTRATPSTNASPVSVDPLTIR
jgi:uncharacterized protein with PQ loop repeat